MSSRAAAVAWLNREIRALGQGQSVDTPEMAALNEAVRILIQIGDEEADAARHVTAWAMTLQTGDGREWWARITVEGDVPVAVVEGPTQNGSWWWSVRPANGHRAMYGEAPTRIAATYEADTRLADNHNYILH